ncbi:MAG: DUF190 domain-containing protein [Acidaminococcaceae bacterium]|nr:DUF190 domain-containing protein [Acidaminococcaceae bacterium]MDD4722823.1 DUF190 domain-containing protein [Acidaminococcaceae bacterium]
MTLNRKCKALKIYISEDSEYKGHSLYHAITHKFAELGMAGATVTRGLEGFGHEKRMRSTSIIDISLNLPIIIEIIDTAEKIEQVIPLVNEMVEDGLITVTDVNVIKYGKESTKE